MSWLKLMKRADLLSYTRSAAGEDGEALTVATGARPEEAQAVLNASAAVSARVTNRVEGITRG